MYIRCIHSIIKKTHKRSLRLRRKAQGGKRSYLQIFKSSFRLEDIVYLPVECVTDRGASLVSFQQ